MSLIHQALKKVAGEGKEGEEKVNGEPPAEAFVGGKKSLKEQLTPRTIVLLAVAILALIFMIYKRACSKPTAYVPKPIAPIGQAQNAMPQPVAPQGAVAGQQFVAPSASAENPAMTAIIEEGQKLYDAGKYDEAMAKFVEVTSVDPQNAVAFNNIGLIYKKKNNYAQAENYYKKALAIRPDYPECLNNLAVLKVASGDTLEASLFLKKAISADSTYADAYFNLAVLNDNQGNYKEAISNYKLFLQYTATTDNSLTTKIKDRIDQLSE